MGFNSAPTLLIGVFTASLTLVAVTQVSNTVSGAVESEAQRSFEDTAERIEEFCKNEDAGSKEKLIEVPERGNITIEDEVMTGWGGQDSNGEIRQFGPRDLDCAYIEVEGSEPVLKETRTRKLEKISGIGRESIRINR